MARVPGRRGPPTLHPRGRSSAVLLAALLSIHCAAMGAAPAETELTAGVAVNGTTAKNEAAFFPRTLAPYEDAVLTLTMLDGDADVYVLGPHSRLSIWAGTEGRSAPLRPLRERRQLQQVRLVLVELRVRGDGRGAVHLQQR